MTPALIALHFSKNLVFDTKSDFAEVLQRGGWEGRADTMFFGGHRVMHHGITLAVTDLTAKSVIANAIADGLKRASLPFKWEEMPALQRGQTLFVDMIE